MLNIGGAGEAYSDDLFTNDPQLSHPIPVRTEFPSRVSL